MSTGCISPPAGSELFAHGADKRMQVSGPANKDTHAVSALAAARASRSTRRSSLSKGVSDRSRFKFRISAPAWAQAGSPARLRQMGRSLSIVLFAGICVTVFGAPLSQSSTELGTLLDQHRTQPSDWKLCNEVAIAYTQAGQFDNAAVFYRKVLSLNPAFVPARKNLGVVLWFANRKAAAEEIFRRLVTEIPKDVVPHLYLGLAHYERRQFAEAKPHFSQAAELAMDNPEVLPAVVDTYLSVKDETIVPHAIQFSESTSELGTVIKLAAVFNRHGQYASTVRVLENRAPLAPDASALLAEAWDKQNQPDRAFAILAKAIDAHPEQEQGYVALAAFAAAHQNNEYALKTLERGLAHHPRSAELLLQRGLLIALGGDREAAKQSFRAAGEANPQWSLPVLALGIVQLEAGHADQAVETFQTAIRIAPRESQGYYLCALAMSRSAEPNRADAIPMLRKALAISPKDARPRVLLGQLQISAGRLREGVAELERALRFDSKNKRALYQLALSYRKLGRTSLAAKYMAEFMALKGKDEEDQTELVQIMKILK